MTDSRKQQQKMLEELYSYKPGELDRWKDDKISELYYREFIAETNYYEN